MNNFRPFIFIGIDNTFHKTNFTTLNGKFSSYQLTLLCALQSEVWSFVWMGNSNKSTFLHQRDLERWDSHDHPIFPPPNNWQEDCIFLFPLQIFTFYISRKKVGKLTVIQTSTVPHNCVQVSFTPNCFPRGFVFFWRTKWVLLNIPINENFQCLFTFLSPSSISSTMLDIRLQMSTESKREGRKSFT